MHGKFCNMPKTLCGTNVMGAYMFQYLINILSDTNSGMIMTLVDVLMDVLDGLDRHAYFNIDMTVIPSSCRQKRIIGNDTVVINGLTFGVGIGPAIVRPGVFWIAILTQPGFWAKVLWKMLAAFFIDHAGSLWVFWTTRTVHHALCYGGIEHGMSNRVKDLRRDDGVYMGSIMDLILLPQKDEEMDVR